MRPTPLLAAAASLAALSIAVPAMAQTQPMPAYEPAPAPPPTTDPVTGHPVMPPRADPARDIADSAGQPAAIPTDSPTPVDQAYLLKAGDPTVTSNPPVPDTPATRAAYGGPESNGGRQTRPVGN